jgi:hypothetical protein
MTRIEANRQYHGLARTTQGLINERLAEWFLADFPKESADEAFIRAVLEEGEKQGDNLGPAFLEFFLHLWERAEYEGDDYKAGIADKLSDFYESNIQVDD